MVGGPRQGILKMEVIEGEVRQLLKMLQYKGLLERYFDVSKGQEVFVLAPGQGLTMESPYTQVPCGVCPVRSLAPLPNPPGLTPLPPPLVSFGIRTVRNDSFGHFL